MYPHRKIWHPIALIGALVAATVLATSTVTVEAGDTLSEIAERNDATIAELVAWNDIDDPNLIFEGVTLIVSAPDGAAGAPTGTPSADLHVVTAGDTLSAIAARFGTSVARLISTNELANPDRIFVGQRLVLNSDPGATAAVTPEAPGRIHVVAPGDTLGAIAARYGVKTGVLARDNDITNVDHIVVGTTLSIGVPTATVDTPSPSPTPTTPVPPTTIPTPTTTTLPPTVVSSPTTTTPAPPAPSPSPSPVRRNGEVLLVPLFTEWSGVYGVPQDLLEAIAWKESDWHYDAVGPNGHLGVGQLSPDTIGLIQGGLLGRDMDPLDAEDGVQMAARYLRYLLDRTDSEREATAAWAQGLQSVQRDGVTAAGGSYADAVEEIRQGRR